MNAQTKVDWTAYQRQVERQKPKMIAAMQILARELGIPAHMVWDDDGDDFSVAFSVSREGDGEREGYRNRLDVRFAIWDSGDADDGIYGEHGNFIFDMAEEGGRIIGQMIPENYSDEVWVPYSEDTEWDSRRELLVAGFDEVAQIVKKWQTE